MDLPTRKSGLERPFHSFQILSWVMQFFNMLAIYCITLSCFEEENQIIIGTIYSFLQFSVIFFGFKLTKSDPSDETVELFRKAEKVQANQIEEKNEKFCNFCRSPVFFNSKHCVRCNRCTRNFDHHCKWVNNCVGEKNYKVFIILIAGCLMLEVFLTVLSAYILIFSGYRPDDLNRTIRKYYKKSFSFNIFIVTEAILGIEGVIFTCLLGYLVGLHIYLKFKGWTTYEFILSRRSGHQIIPKRELNNSVEENKTIEKCSKKSPPFQELDAELEYRV